MTRDDADTNIPLQSLEVDYSDRLRSHLERVGLESFNALGRAAGVSKWQVLQLRQGKVLHLRGEVLLKFSQVLHLSLSELLATFSTPGSLHNDLPTLPSPQFATPEASGDGLTAVQQDYARLQTQLQDQRDRLWQEFQHTTVQQIESWLIQWPTAAHAAQHNEQVPAVRLLPLMRPLEQLLSTWNIEAIAPVGSEVAYDPHQHQLMEGSAQPGDRVRVRYTGYIQGDRLLYRAKVSPVAQSTQS